MRHLKAVGLGAIEDGPQAQFQDQQGMIEQKAAQVGARGEAFLDFEQEGFHIGALRMRALAWPGSVDDRLGNHAPIEEGKEGAVALHEGVVLEHPAQSELVKDL
jgi:hypothetical protein